VDRRQFLLGLSALALSPRASASETGVDGARLNRRLRELAAFGRTAEGGISRVAFSDADRMARELAISWMREAGLEVRLDAAANVIGRREGRDRSLPALLFGSHVDSVPDGGNYDGQVGSVGAIEVVQSLRERGIETLHPLEVILFTNEENGKTGSRAMAGELEERELLLPSHGEKTIAEGISFLGGDPARVAEARRKPGEVFAFLELHIEQGAVLHRRGIDVGVVEGIVGIERWNVRVDGFANHAGTTPMDERRDPLLTASRIIDAVNGIATEIEGRHVATVGKIAAHPGAPNVIPGRVELTLEIRDLDMAKIATLQSAIEEQARKIASRNETSVSFEKYYESRGAPADDRLREVIRKSAEALGLTTLSLPSGAGHDAQSLALLAPMGMIFVPSVDGISHSPKELTLPEDVEAGANVLLSSVLATDGLALT
jgi:beta-ureidopropionase / N-carbamoyl-L-amino-acid hydrolase